MEGWFTVSLDDEARFSPSYAALGERASTETLVVFVGATLLVGTALWWTLTQLLWGWLSWLCVCLFTGYVLRTRLSLLIPQPLIKYLRKKSHAT